MRLIIALFALPLANLQLSAQETPAAEVPPTIRKLIINFTGLSNVNEEVARANMSLREGEPYDPMMVDRDIRSLYRSSLFEYIEARIAQVGDKQVDVIFDIRPKFRISAIIFDGNERLSDRKLENEIEIVVNQTLNEPKVKEAAEKIQELYLKRGFSQARVEYQIDRNPGSGFGSVTFQIREGRKFKIRKVEFIGNENLKGRKLKKDMKTKKWGFFSVFSGSGRFDRDKFEDDLETLKDNYRKEGFLDIDVDPSNVKFSYPTDTGMEIAINIDEGKQYRIGTIDFEGNSTHQSSVLKLLLRVLPGDIYRPEKIDEDVDRIEKFYGQFGYMDTRVRMVRVPNVQTGNIDIKYVVRESEKFEVASIDIEGNTKTKSVVVLRELALSPGSTFDSVRMESSRMRLENTRYFEDPNVTSQSTNIPGRKDLRITFKEGRTGNFSFGAGFSSLERGVFFIELTQSNFDIMNWRGAFQGDGQKFRMKAQIGGRSSSFVLAFEEPWLFEQRLALGIQVFKQSSNYTDAYESVSEGFEVSLRKRLIELIEGRVSYSFTDQYFDDFSPSLPIADQLAASRGTISRVNVLFMRDTRDRLINTYRGMRLELDTSYAGDFLGGTFEFYKLETRTAFYLPIAEKLTQTVEFIARAGIIDGLENNSRIPYQEYYFLGGPNTLRGFEYNDISPKDSGVRGGHFRNPPYATGGKTYGMFGAEYSFGITDDFRVAAFYDGGFVNKATADFTIERTKIYDNTGNYHGQTRSGWNSNYGFGLRLSMMGTPLRLDYALPITTDGDPSIGGNDNGPQFNFSFGGRF